MTLNQQGKSVDFSKVGRKLREATFFLNHTSQHAQMAFGEPEHFHYYLSALPSSSRSVIDVLGRQGKGKFRRFFPTWKRGLTPEEQQFLDFMGDRRNEDVHEGEVTHERTDRDIPVYNQYSDASGRVVAFGPVTAMPLARVVRREFYFDVHGKRVSVVDAGRLYLDLLARLVEDFRRSL